jgi:hypothetical protein
MTGHEIFFFRKPFLRLLHLLSPHHKYPPKIFVNPHPPEAVKKLLQVERAGRDIEKVSQRYLFTLTICEEKL